MLCFLSPETDPAWNLAAEEYLLKAGRENCFMLWCSRSAVIIGRNQNPHAEADSRFLDAQEIPLLRRLSGGGTVYHDPGNLNFSRIDVDGGNRLADFRHYTRPVVDFLNQLGVPAVFTGRSDLSLHGNKISGNAQFSYRGKLLHHGTLLFDSDLDQLARAIRADPSPYRDKAVQSLRRRVTNIRPYLAQPLTVSEFMRQLLAYLQKLGNGRQAVFSAADKRAIETLAEEKYRRWHWNFGHSPTYEFTRSTATPAGTLQVQLQVAKGLIQAVNLGGHGAIVKALRPAAQRLTGRRHCRPTIARVLASYPCPECQPAVVMEDLVSAFF